MIRCGLDRLVADPARLRGRRYGVLTHAAAVTRELVPIQLALAAVERPSLFFGPEHGLFGVEQDMVAAEDHVEPGTGVPIRSLYGDSEQSLRPAPDAFSGLDLLVVDLQDVGARYYTYAATAVWAAEVALAAGCEVWILDRPNPLGGERIEGNLREPGLESFIGAFRLPVRHGLTLGELVALEARRRGWETSGLDVVRLEGWRREMGFAETGLPWVAPSPNIPTLETVWLYPGGCLIEATELSEGRGTTRPFKLVGAPGLDAYRLAERLRGLALPGLEFLPTYFRPQFQKHAGRVCGGVEICVTDAAAVRPYRFGLELVRACFDVAPEQFAWRERPYEFVADRPAIDLLSGSSRLRSALESGDGFEDWVASFAADERAFREEREAVLLYS